MSSHARKVGVFAALLVGLALAVAACGSSNKSSTSSSASTAPAAPASTTPASTTGAGGAGDQSVTDYVKYVGGTAGKADSSKSPVYIGWVNQQGGQQVIGAAATDGADLAVKVINDQLAASMVTPSR